jgi:preprotein translocase subunit SecY
MYQGGQTFLPLRVNQAGVIPIIFAISILLFPSQIASYFQNSEVEIVANISRWIVEFFSPQRPIYVLMYFLLTVGFTYFYTAFTFKPDETAEQLRKNGGFIPGIRPGRPTADYLAKVVTQSPSPAHFPPSWRSRRRSSRSASRTSGRSASVARAS